MNRNIILDPSLSLRLANWKDINAVAKLNQEVAEIQGDALFVLTAEELVNEWKNQGFIVERDVFIVETRDGRVVGSEEFYSENDHQKLIADGCVHPEFKKHGIGSSLLEKIEERAQTEMELADPVERVFIQSSVNINDEEGLILLRNNGYSPVRYHWRMEIKLQETPMNPSFPEGIELRPFIKEKHSTAVWQADNEAFRDHWGSHDRIFEEWSHRKFGNPNFDPSLWLVAWEGNEVTGFSQNRFRKGIGWIGTIAVRRPWRRKGLGIALLRQTFCEFYKRGMNTIGLGVDSKNLTGATRLYQRVGMSAVSEFATYEKELRAGKN